MIYSAQTPPLHCDYQHAKTTPLLKFHENLLTPGITDQYLQCRATTTATYTGCFRLHTILQMWAGMGVSRSLLWGTHKVVLYLASALLTLLSVISLLDTILEILLLRVLVGGRKCDLPPGKYRIGICLDNTIPVRITSEDGRHKAAS